MNQKNIEIQKPTPILLQKEYKTFSQNSDVKETIGFLLNNENILITDLYSDGLLLLNALQKHLKNKFPAQNYLEQRVYRKKYKEASNLILLKVFNHELIVKKSPEIGWLKKLYPDTLDFYLSFPQVQGLNSAWQWYKKGITIPQLRNKIHPYYGVYFPTRFEHLELFDQWLSRYKGMKKTVIDVGIGSGILTFILMKHGFQKSYGTDINANAIIGLQESIENTKFSKKIELDFDYLFGKWEKPTELIVFNPPWLPTSQEMGMLDEAMYYRENLFSDFFTETKKRLLPDGKVLLLFSNIAMLTKTSKVHPITYELENNTRFKLEKCYTKKMNKDSSKTNRDAYWRKDEQVELWILVHY